MTGRFADNPAYVEYEGLLREIHRLIATGKGDSGEADAVRDRMEGPERRLSRAEIDRLNTLSADLYRAAGGANAPTEPAPIGREPMPAKNLPNFQNFTLPEPEPESPSPYGEPADFPPTATFTVNGKLIRGAADFRTAHVEFGGLTWGVSFGPGLPVTLVTIAYADRLADVLPVDKWRAFLHPDLVALIDGAMRAGSAAE